VLRTDTKEHFVAKMVKYKHMSRAEKEFILREVQTMTHISTNGGHPYLVRFRESFVLASGQLCIIMDYCDAGDLAQLISTTKRKKQAFPEPQVHLWLLQLLSAVDFLHSKRVLHRDIKPANIFMHSGVCKLGDLGLSKQVMAAATQPGKHTQCGSPLYLAPEAHMGQKYSKMLDIWSLGCTLYELMHGPGEHAFQGRDNAEILKNIAWAKHAKIKTDAWSAPLCSILERMLALKPADRPGAREVINDPAFAAALQSGTLHPLALRHQYEDGTESPDTVHATLSADLSRPASAPPELKKQEGDGHPTTLTSKEPRAHAVGTAANQVKQKEVTPRKASPTPGGNRPTTHHQANYRRR
jgi:NIMA (never in mitosis gene a)-related kinase